MRLYGSLELLLRYVPEEHLEGLHTIVVTNSEYMRKAVPGKYIQEKRRFRAADYRGMYCNREIWLIIDRICDVELFMIIPPARTILIGEVLYHEIGHYIHAMQQPGFKKEKEAFAAECKDRLMQSFVSQRYWYLRGILKLFAPLIRPLYRKWQRSVSEA